MNIRRGAACAAGLLMLACVDGTPFDPCADGRRTLHVTISQPDSIAPLADSVAAVRGYGTAWSVDSLTVEGCVTRGPVK